MSYKVEWKSMQDILAKRKLTGDGQRFLSNEVLRLSNKRVPVQKHILKNTAQVVNDGKAVVWVQPYAKKQYYDTPPTRTYDSMRGGKWFERTKTAEGLDILRSTASFIGGKPK